jgi:hypothetical protein
MERADKTEFILTVEDVNTAVKEYIKKAYGEMPRGNAAAKTTTVHKIHPIEPPAGVSDHGAPIYEYAGVKVTIG